MRTSQLTDLAWINLIIFTVTSCSNHFTQRNQKKKTQPREITLTAYIRNTGYISNRNMVLSHLQSDAVIRTRIINCMKTYGTAPPSHAYVSKLLQITVCMCCVTGVEWYA